MNVQLQKGIVLRVFLVKGLEFLGKRKYEQRWAVSRDIHAVAGEGPHRAAENGKVNVLLRHTACLLTAVQHITLGRRGVRGQGVRCHMPIVCETEETRKPTSVSQSQQRKARGDMTPQLTFS